MRVKITNRKTQEFEILECISFDISFVTVQAGRGTTRICYNPKEYEIVEQKEESL